MKRILLYISLITFSIIALGQSAPLSESNYNLQGKIINERGNPLANVSVEIHGQEDRETIYKTSTDENGFYKIVVPEILGKCWLRATAEYCGAVVRSFDSSAQLQSAKVVDITMICSDPPLPIQLQEHRKNPGVTYKKYLGTYKVAFICKDEKTDGGTIVLQGLNKSVNGKCKCGDKSRVFSWVGACGEFGCWHVEDNGDIKMSFPCGAILAGEKFTLWEEGDQLIGYGESWSDAGGGRKREIILKPKMNYTSTSENPLVIQLIDSNKTGIGKGFVEIRKNADDKSPIISGLTDFSGRFSFPNRPNLTQIFVRAAVCSFNVREVEAKLSQEIITVELDKEKPLAELCNIKPDASTAVLCIRVKSEECFPLHETQLELTDIVNGQVRKIAADKNGVAIFSNLTPGRSYKLITEAPGYCTIVRKVDGLKAGSAEYIELTAYNAFSDDATM